MRIGRPLSRSRLSSLFLFIELLLPFHSTSSRRGGGCDRIEKKVCQQRIREPFCNKSNGGFWANRKLLLMFCPFSMPLSIHCPVFFVNTFLLLAPQSINQHLAGGNLFSWALVVLLPKESVVVRRDSKGRRRRRRFVVRWSSPSFRG